MVFGVLGALAARADASPRLGESFTTWYGDPADDRELAAETAADDAADGGDAHEVAVSSADAVTASAAVDPFADPVSAAALVAASGASSIGEPLASAGDPDDPSGRLRRRSRWGALDITVLARRQWTLPEGGTPAAWTALWLLATWRH